MWTVENAAPEHGVATDGATPPAKRLSAVLAFIREQQLARAEARSRRHRADAINAMSDCSKSTSRGSDARSVKYGRRGEGCAAVVGPELRVARAPLPPAARNWRCLMTSL